MMKPLIKTTCPLCNAPAQYYEVDHAERHYYECPSCTKYIVTLPAETRLRQMKASAVLSQQARAATSGNDERILEIGGSYDPGSSHLLRPRIVNKKDYDLGR